MKQKLEILFDHKDYIVVNKASGMLSIRDALGSQENCADILQKKLGRVFIVHRIDQETSGCLVFAKNEEAHRHASMLFQNHEVEKIYHAIVVGKTPENGIIEKRLAPHAHRKNMMTLHDTEGKEAYTSFKTLEHFRHHSHVECRIKTGRMHQIRVHFKWLGHPLLCDPLYGTDESFYVSSIKRNYKLDHELEQEKPILSRLALHAFSIRFRDHQENEIFVQAPLFKDMLASLQQMRKWK